MERRASPRLSHFAVVVGLAGCATGPGYALDDADASSSPPQFDTDAAHAGDAGTPPPDASSACSGLSGTAGDLQWSIESGGRERALRIHVPDSYDPAVPMPVVLNFHGYTSNAWQQEQYTGMADKADDAGFIAVHPDGVQNSWNAGGCCGNAAQQNIDDVGFVEDLLDALAAEYCVDTARVYATGMSNGGFMSHRLACELSDRITAIASVAGYNVSYSCAPTRPVPVLHIHGTADGTVGYDGVAATIAGWVERNGCDGEPTTTYDYGDATCQTYSGCDDEASVVLCTIAGGGHAWPGAFGANNDLDATDAAWEFLSGYRR